MTAQPTLLRILRGIAEAPVEAVAGVLLDIGPDGSSPILPPGEVTPIERDDGGAYSVVVEQAGSRVTIAVDPIARTASVQGQWWYRADIALTPHEDGCLITQQIFNVARRLRWSVRYVARKPLAASPHAFAQLLDTVHERLGCPTHPIP
jgi:hypothetical protein